MLRNEKYFKVVKIMYLNLKDFYSSLLIFSEISFVVFSVWFSSSILCGFHGVWSFAILRSSALLLHR